ncbi:MAG: DUF2625 domain-containing protein [Ferruginibacter sp.]
MARKILMIVFLFAVLVTKGQNKMRSADELISRDEPAWPIVKEWIESAKNKTEILPADTIRAKDALFKTQVTTRSPMGAVVYMTGGILIQDGWIRVLGSWSERMNRSLPEWNKGKSFNEFGEQPSFLLIADDVIGGFFILNGGSLGNDLGKVYYFSPDNLEYEPLGITYTEFLDFCFNGNLDKFYEGRQWANWKDEVSGLAGDKAFGFYPYLWTKEGKDINTITRKIISVEELYQFNTSIKKQLNKE